MTHLLKTPLADWRRKRGWSQERLADVSRVSPRTIQRIEQGAYEPHPKTLAALADALELPVSDLIPDARSEYLAEVEDRYVCPSCGAMLERRGFVDFEYGDCEIEEFACGYSRGWHTRPCPNSPQFPKFEDYDLGLIEEVDGYWYCVPSGTTAAAREVSLGVCRGSTREGAIKRAMRAYVEVREGCDAAEKFLPILDTV